MPHDVIVLGAGIHGAASAYRLARAGKRVLLLEQFEPLHHRGSSHGETRVIRSAYEHPDYIPLVRWAFEAWGDLERKAEVSLLERRAHVDLARPDHPGFAAVRAAMTQAEAPFEELDPTRLRRHFPALSPPEDYHGLLDPGAGLVRGTASVQVFLRLALRHGAALHAGGRVRALAPSRHGWRVETEAQVWEAEQVVIAAGAWTNAVLRDLGWALPLDVFRTQSALFRPRHPARLGELPIFYDHHTSVYGLPEREGGALKVGNRHREPVDPDRRSFEPIPANLDVLEDWVGRHVPGLPTVPEDVLTCLYTFTPDEDFVIDRVPGVEGAVVISACSGHGFKFAPVVAELVVDLLGGAAPHPLFRANRFETAPAPTVGG